jgi:hypothetical protein
MLSLQPSLTKKFMACGPKTEHDAMDATQALQSPSAKKLEDTIMRKTCTHFAGSDRKDTSKLPRGTPHSHPYPPMPQNRHIRAEKAGKRGAWLGLLRSPADCMARIRRQMQCNRGGRPACEFWHECFGSGGIAIGG